MRRFIDRIQGLQKSRQPIRVPAMSMKKSGVIQMGPEGRARSGDQRANMPFWGSIVAAVLTGLFAILGIAWQLNVQRQQFEKMLLLDGAYSATQDLLA
jgi:hypothetical protein